MRPIKFSWYALLGDERFSGAYRRSARVISSWGGNQLIEIKTERGAIKITTSEIENILRHLKS